MPLADIQRGLYEAIVLGEPAPRDVHGGTGTVEGRLRIYQRHHASTVLRALLSRFPATQWLVGSSVLLEVASPFVQAHPPQAPCLFEYGEAFPSWLAHSPVREALPYIEAFAALDWQLGMLAVQVGEPAISIQALPTRDEADLSSLVLTLQTGLHYRALSWAVDTLLTAFLSDLDGALPAPEPVRTLIEARGAAGRLSLHRLSEAEWTFRSAVQTGAAIGSAAEHALGCDPAFDPGSALVRLFSEGCVTDFREDAHVPNPPRPSSHLPAD